MNGSRVNMASIFRGGEFGEGESPAWEVKDLRRLKKPEGMQNLSCNESSVLY